MSDVRLRHLARINPLTPAFDRLADNDELTFVPMEAVWPDSRLDLTRRRTKSAVATGYTRFQDGDVLVPKITPTFEASRSVLIQGLLGGVGAGTTELHVVRPGPDIDPQFLLYTVNTHTFLRLGASEMYGVAGQQRVPDSFLRDLRVRLPSLPEQRCIADFLNAETAHIDRLAAAQRRLAAKLREREALAVEHHLSQASSHQVRLKNVLLAPPSYGANESAEHDRRDWPRYIRTTDIAEDGSLRESTFASLPPEAARKYMMDDGDLLFVRSGATVGKSFVYEARFGPAAHAGYLIRARVDSSLMHSRLIWYFCQTRNYWQQVSEGTLQATIQNVNAEKYGNLLIPMISRDRQVPTLTALDRIVTKSRTLRRDAGRMLDLLAERRQALITAAVTGQFDVSTASGRNVTDGVPTT
ncbi:restriction endonuclease subunit S [Streptomyces sp. NPDC057249]|uniref:restriction endonuclease subunit S n=1 Tax=Streptomyces sp. NPDC057249 TaxID=3346067 RepID=UPI0036319847